MIKKKAHMLIIFKYCLRISIEIENFIFHCFMFEIVILDIFNLILENIVDICF